MALYVKNKMSLVQFSLYRILKLLSPVIELLFESKQDWYIIEEKKNVKYVNFYHVNSVIRYFSALEGPPTGYCCFN